MHAVHTVPAFSDNYIWLQENSDGTAQVVDPGDASVVNDALEARGLRLTSILLTHHHFDHVGGVEELKGRHDCRVYGPDNPGIEFALDLYFKENWRQKDLPFDPANPATYNLQDIKRRWNPSDWFRSAQSVPV